MRTFIALITGFAICATGGGAAAQITAGPPPLPSVTPQTAATGDEIVVVGRRTGPRLWRVTKPDASGEIFILVSVETVPEDLEWESSGIALLLEDAQEVLLSPSAAFGAGNRARMAGAVIRTLIFNPGRIRMKRGETLADKVGPDLAAQFDRARARVDARARLRKDRKKETREKDDPDAAFEGLDEASQERIEKRLQDLKPERLHPFLQAGTLQGDALESAGLEYFETIEKDVAKLARKAKVKSRPISEIDVAFRDIKQALKSIQNFSENTNRLCIVDAIDFAENQLEIEAARADAWARGNVAYLRQTARPERLSPCGKALSDELQGLKTFGGAKLEDVDTVALWTDEIDRLLSEDGIRLAIIPDNVWLRPDGAMDRLRQNGAIVRSPD